MKGLLLPAVGLLACYLIFFWYVYFSYDALPERVASHFDAAGQPDGWMSRGITVVFSVATAILLPSLILGAMTAAGWMPAKFVNLPNRDYWLAPEQRRTTRRVLLKFGLWFCCLNVLFLTGLHALIVQANAADAPPHLSGSGIAVVAGGFFLATLAWLGFLLLYFSRRPGGG